MFVKLTTLHVLTLEPPASFALETGSPDTPGATLHAGRHDAVHGDHEIDHDTGLIQAAPKGQTA